MQNQQTILGQNQQKKAINQNQGIPLIQNQIMANNQLQYQQQLALQQAQRNQQLQNIQKAQHTQKIHNLPQNQLLNTQIIPQGKQNIQKYPQTQVQNPHTHHNTQIPHNVNIQQQTKIGQEAPKTFIPGQIQNKPNNLQITKNQKIQQNKQVNQFQGQQLKTQKPLAVSHLNLGQTPNLDSLPQNQKQQIHTQKQMHQQQQNPTPQNPQQHKQHQQHQLPPKPLNQKNQQKKVEENLTNTTFKPFPQNIQPNQNQNQVQPKLQTETNAANAAKKSATSMTVNSLANLPYNAYPQAEYSKKPFYNISGYAHNSYNGAIKSYNEDMVQAVKEKLQFSKNNEPVYLNISYFGVFDGHGGDKCSKFLKENMHKYLLKSNLFVNNPVEAIKEAFNKAENEFSKIAIKNGKLEDKSGSCAVISLIINNTLYSINLGDSRALYSRDGGKELYQITRDHKPNDEKERKRIEKNGGKVYYANKTIKNGVEITLKEEDFGKNFTFPYRVLPSGLAVSFFYLIIV